MQTFIYFNKDIAVLFSFNSENDLEDRKRLVFKYYIIYQFLPIVIYKILTRRNYSIMLGYENERKGKGDEEN